MRDDIYFLKLVQDNRVSEKSPYYTVNTPNTNDYNEIVNVRITLCYVTWILTVQHAIYGLQYNNSPNIIEAV